MTDSSAWTSTKRAPQRRRTVQHGTAIPATSNIDRKQLLLLRKSFTQIEEQGGIVGLMFYQTLFRYEPALRSLFQTSVDLQARKLMGSLSYAVATLERPKALIPVLEALGRRHVVYGVCDRHYALVTNALIETFKEILGSGFTPEVHEAWRQALNFVATTMKQSAAQYPTANGSAHDRENCRRA
jgi:hemoglobin-like flavoprotein